MASSERSHQPYAFATQLLAAQVQALEAGELGEGAKVGGREGVHVDLGLELVPVVRGAVGDPARR